MLRARLAITLVELLVVVAILAGMVSLLLPAIQNARESARNSVCQNNLRQINIAARSHVELGNPFPTTRKSWTVDLLPWLEERPLMDALKNGNTAAAIGSRPPLYQCPSQTDTPVDDSGIQTCHYTIDFVRNRHPDRLPTRATEISGVRVRDRFLNFQEGKTEPWYDGPLSLTRSLSEYEGKGPHGGKTNLHDLPSI